MEKKLEMLRVTFLSLDQGWYFCIKTGKKHANSIFELPDACIRVDNKIKERIELENSEERNAEAIDNHDKRLADAKITFGDSESKLEDISRKLATIKSDDIHPRKKFLS